MARTRMRAGDALRDADGKQAFESNGQASLIAAILERDPPSVADSAPRRWTVCCGAAWRRILKAAGSRRAI
jgi:hypothetical protein